MDMFGLGILLNAKDQASASIFRVNTALQGLMTTMNEAGEVSETQMDRITQSMQNATSLLEKGLQLTTLGSEIAGFGTSIVQPLVAVGQQALSTGSQFEQWRMTLNALYKDSEVATQKASEAMQLAAQTPFEVGDVMEALIGFKAIGAEALTVMDNVEGASDQTRTFLEYVGDLASLRPDVGLNGVLLGIRNLLGGDGGKSLKMRMDIDFEQIMGEDWKDTPEEIMQQIANVSQQIAGGLMEKLEGTWSQMMSNLEDQTTRFFLAIADNGAFDSFKKSLKYISDSIASIDDERMARIGQNIASAFTMIWQPIDFVIRKLTDFAMAIVNLIETSPLISKLVVGFVSLAGATAIIVGGLVVLSGALLLVQGGLKIIQLAFASLGPIMLSFKAKLISMGTALVPLLPKIALLTTAVALLNKGWKSDFGGIRTSLTNFVKNTRSAFKDSSDIASMSVDDMMNALNNLNKDTWYGRLTYNLTKLKVFWMGLCDAWNDYELSDENFQKLNALGLLPLLGTILDLKMRAEAFFDGFKQGWKNIFNVISPIIAKIIDFIKDIAIHLLPAKDKVDEFQSSAEGLDTTPWYDLGEAIAYVSGILAGIWATSKVIGIISTITSAISGVVSFVMGIPSVIAGAFSGIWGLFSTLGGVIGTALGWIGTLVTTILGAFGIVISAPAWVVGAITLVIAGIVALIITKWTEIKEFTIETWTKIKDKTSEIWGGIKQWYDSNIKPWVDTISQFFIKCKDKVVESLTSIKDSFLLKWGEIKQWYDTNIQPWVDIVAKLFEIAFALIRAGLLMLRDFFIEKWGDIKQWYTDNIEPWIESVKQGWDNFKAKVSEIFSGIKDFFVEKWGEVKAWYDSNIQPWIDTIQEKWGNFKAKVSEVYGNIKTSFVEAWNGIKDWYNTTIQPWVDKVLGLWDSFKSSVGAVWDSISTAWHTTIDNLYTWVVGKVNGLIDMVNKIPFVEIEKIEAKTGSSAPVKKSSVSRNVIGLNTGGYVKNEGMALLHPNEVVVNDDLTQRLRSFLSANEGQSSNNARMITPNVTLEPVITPNITVNVPEGRSITQNYSTNSDMGKVIPLSNYTNNNTTLEDVINNSNTHYDNSRSLVNNYSNTDASSTVSNVTNYSDIVKNLSKNIYEENVKHLYSNLSTISEDNSILNKLINNNSSNTVNEGHVYNDSSNYNTENNSNSSLTNSNSNTNNVYRSLSTTMNNSTSTDNRRETANSKVDNSITFSEGAIQITMTNGNEADIDKLVRQIATKLKKEANLRSTLNYKPLVG